MLTLTTEELSNRLTKTAVICEVNEPVLHRAVDIFNDFKSRRIILNADFEDNAWSFTDQRKIVGLRFETSAVEGWIGCTADVYARCVKAYAAFQLGRLGLIQIQAIVRTLISMSALTADDACQLENNHNHIAEFLKIIPSGCASRDAVIETLEERTGLNGSKDDAQRVLADFRTYLKFDEIISRYWDSAGHEQRLAYFPLYFWWKLTAILPLRPTEFLLTPRDCLHGKVLTVRRTRLKNKGVRVSYSIDGDYELYKYEISEHLATELRAYIAATDAFRQNEIDTLLVPTTNFIDRVSDNASKYYTYGRLRMCLLAFYDEAVIPSGIEIGGITLGDTRHLAMINLIISGGSPSACRELAGHADINISSHYYANIANLVECATLEHLRKSRGGAATLTGEQRYPLARPVTAHRVHGGWCGAVSVENGDVSECLKAISADGFIGECAYCAHYWPDEQGLRLSFYDKGLGKRRVEADTEHLLHMVEIVRRGIGYTEDVGSALLRLQRSCAHYHKCILESIEYGKT